MAKLAPPPIAVRVAHAAQLLDCSRQHVYDLIERGSLRRQQIEGSTAVRVPLVDVYRVLGLEAPSAVSDASAA